MGLSPAGGGLPPPPELAEGFAVGVASVGAKLVGAAVGAKLVGVAVGAKLVGAAVGAGGRHVK